MLHAMFQDHRIIGSDSTSNLALIDPAVLEKKIFENGGHIHVYSPGTGTENHMSQFFH